MANEIEKTLFSFVLNGLIEEPKKLGVEALTKSTLIKSSFYEFDHGIGGYSYEKNWRIYNGRQDVNLTIFFNPNEELFYHLQFEFGYLNLYRFLKKYFLYLDNDHRLIFYKARDKLFSECYAIKTENSIIHFRKDHGRKKPYIKKIDSINENLTNDTSPSLNLDILEKQFLSYGSLNTKCSDKELKMKLISITS